MTNQIDALNAMAVLVADRNYQGAVDIAACLDHERLAEITVALVRMCAVSQIEFFHCQDLSEDQARGQAAAFFRAGLGFPQKDGGIRGRCQARGGPGRWGRGNGGISGAGG